jgi:penicillin-binding protein 1A
MAAEGAHSRRKGADPLDPAAPGDAKPRTEAKPARPPRPLWVKRLKQILAVVALLVMLVVIVGAIVFFKAVDDAKALLPKMERQMDALRTPPSVIVSADGVVLQRIGTEYREPIHKLSEVPTFVQNAVIAAEDRRFWKHSGVDFWSLARVLFTGAQAGRFSAGGSTLEMQLAKLITSHGQKTFQRKFQDIALAYDLGQEWTKEEILKFYLNQVYFGSGAYGIKAAAEVYFDKGLDQITLAEAAMLARCVRRPSDENPFRNLDRAIENRDVVLRTMLHEGMISQAAFDKADHEKVHLNKARRGSFTEPLFAPYFVNHVRAELAENHPDIRLEEGGYTIRTSLDTRAQHVAERAVTDTVQRYARNRVNVGAFVLMNAKGEILAEVGGPSYKKNQFNIIAQGKRPPGSSFKPILYSTAIAEDHFGPDSYLSNAPLTYVDPESHVSWTPKNSNHNENAPGYSMRTALALSVNIPAAHTILQVGVHNVAKMAHDTFGFRSELHEFPALALGASEVSPLEMAQAYSVFMLRGNRAKPHTIVSIEDPEHESPVGEEAGITRNVLAAEVCDQISDMLRGVVTSGTGTAANIIPDARGKTGTTNDSKDAWFCGYAEGLIGVGWVGNENYETGAIRPMASSVFGGTVTARMWATIFSELPKGLTDNATQTLASAWNPPANPGPPRVAPKPEDKVAIVGEPNDPSAKAPPTDGEPGQLMPGEGPNNDPNSQPKTDSGDLGGDPTPVDPGPQPVLRPSNAAPPPALAGQPRPTRRTPVAAPTGVPTHPPAPVVAERRPAAVQPEAMVDVDICVETGLVANEYCPEVVTRHYRKSRVPKRKCRLHHG